MRISLIVAMDRQNGIGIANRIPWRLPTDLKRFRELTLGHHLVVGRRTFDSIGRPLPGRKMIILSRDPGLQLDDCQVVNQLATAIELARTAGETELFIGGGAEIYDLALPVADRLYLTRVEATLPADTFFPDWRPTDWHEELLSTHPPDERNEYGYSFLIYDRRPAPSLTTPPPQH
jgi:dihydrofolate reductase